MKYFKQISLYSLVGFFNAGISFLLMPYLSHFIDPGGYGILSMANSFVTILIPILGLTASGLISVEYYQIKDKNEFASVFSSIQTIPVIPGIIVLFIAIAFSTNVAGFLEIPISKSYWIPLSVVIALFSIYYETLMAYNVIEQKPIRYLKFSTVRVLFEVGLTILLVSVFRLGWEGRLLSWLIATTVSFFISIYYFKSQNLLTLHIKKKYVKAGILFGLPIILHTLGKFVTNQSDRIFIAKMVSIKDAGIYNIGYQVGMVILIFVNAVTSFIQPFLFERLSNLTEKAKIEIVRVSYLIILGMLALLLLLTFVTPFFFYYLIDKSYLGGRIFVFWTGLGYFFWAIYVVFAGYIFYLKKTKILGYLSILNISLNLVLNYFLILKFGPIGASYATCISYFAIAFIITMVATSFYSLPWLKPRLIFSR